MQVVIEIISEKFKWDKVLSEFEHIDFFHTYDFHRISEKYGEGQPVLYYYKVNRLTIAFPLLVRNINNGFRDYNDLTSVYGYGGPLIKGDYSIYDLKLWSRAMKTLWKERNIVTVFSRLHPLLNQKKAISELSGSVHSGSTVAIDLNIGGKEQIGNYRKSHRYEIKKLREDKNITIKKGKKNLLEDFIEIYTSAMEVLGADEYYRFDEDYFTQMLDSKTFESLIYIAFYQDIPISASIFVFTPYIAEYYLSGSLSEFFKLSPSKLLIDEARIDSVSKGIHWLHLGGGVGGSEDELFNFKKGFSPIVKDFHVLKYVADKASYDDIIDDLKQRKIPVKDNHFPGYR